MSAPHPPRVLVVEDEPRMQRLLETLCDANGYVVVTAADGASGVARAADHQPDLVLLDLGLPDLDGLEVTRRLRSWSAVPIIVLSARGREHDKVEALDAGADDYLTKPFGAQELLARMRAALRRHARGADASPVVTVGEIELDLSTRRVRLRGEEVHLTPLEYRLLTTLARHAGRVLTHRQILAAVWGPGAVEQTHYVRIYASQVRRKIEDDPARPRYLLTESGVGYRFAAE